METFAILYFGFFGLLLISWLFVVLFISVLPIIVAFVRKHNNFLQITILNIVLGWTFLGWLAALLWALNSDVKKAQ